MIAMGFFSDLLGGRGFFSPSFSNQLSNPASLTTYTASTGLQPIADTPSLPRWYSAFHEQDELVEDLSSLRMQEDYVKDFEERLVKKTALVDKVRRVCDFLDYLFNCAGSVHYALDDGSETVRFYHSDPPTYGSYCAYSHLHNANHSTELEHLAEEIYRSLQEQVEIYWSSKKKNKKMKAHYSLGREPMEFSRIPTLPTLVQFLNNSAYQLELHVRGDNVVIKGSNGKECWVSKERYLDALENQRHGDEAELSKGILDALALGGLAHRHGTAYKPKPNSISWREGYTYKISADDLPQGMRTDLSLESRLALTLRRGRQELEKLGK